MLLQLVGQCWLGQMRKETSMLHGLSGLLVLPVMPLIQLGIRLQCCGRVLALLPDSPVVTLCPAAAAETLVDVPYIHTTFHHPFDRAPVSVIGCIAATGCWLCELLLASEWNKSPCF